MLKFSVECSQCKQAGPSAAAKYRARLFARALKWVYLGDSERMICPGCQTEARKADQREAADLELDKMP